MFLEKDGFHETIDKENQYPPDLNLLNWRFENILKPRASKIKGSNVLDIGTHNGQWVYASLKLGACSATGIDREQKYIDQAELNMSKTNIKGYNFVKCDIEQHIPIGFDFLICMNVLYFVKDIDLFFSRLSFKHMIIDTFLNHGTVKSKDWLESKMNKHMNFKEISFVDKPEHYSKKSVYHCTKKYF